ncbi:DsbA family protein [Litorisediminicola beolgyonensis]|uniref:DsbA family protein n=1 Tax=Litorisediminicola beolgyonensis TaxID=1173614 RepID=A0ABW3ZI34_9RHOB
MTRFLLPATLAAVLVAGGGWFLGQPVQTPTGLSLPGAAMAQEAAAPTEAVEIADMTLGAEDAPVEVIEYASYTCPHCARFHEEVFDQLKADYIDSGKVRFTYREVYFDKYGMWASLVARCGGQEKFFGITDMIYAGQNTWARAGADGAIADGLRKIGLLAGLDKDQLEACLTDGEKLRSLVGWYQENATADDVSSTPTFIIDGEKYSNMPYDEFRKVLDDKLGE